MDEMATLLVVDDDEEVLTGTVRTLEKAGYRTLEANNGQECLDAVAKHQPDLVALDVVTFHHSRSPLPMRKIGESASGAATRRRSSGTRRRRPGSGIDSPTRTRRTGRRSFAAGNRV